MALFFYGGEAMENSGFVLEKDEGFDFNIKDIVGSRRLTTYCQQIVSISRKKVVGIEALIRSVDTDTNMMIQPRRLFDAARKENFSIELDRACRENIFEEYKKIYQEKRDKLLFINFDTYTLETTVGSGYLLNQVKQNNLNPSNIVIEISEKDLVSSEKLKAFADTYRECGFMIALDDVGTGFSNMDRILLVKPEIIKIDISIVKNIHNDFYKQGVFKSLVILANKIGALVIAEGVETEQEAIQVIRLGGHMIQGYYFSKPMKMSDEQALFTNSKIDYLSRQYNDYIKRQYIYEKNKHRHLNKIAMESAQKLMKMGRVTFDKALQEIVADNPDIECAYVLGSSGIQISQTISSIDQNLINENLIFYSAKKGTDHSMEKYFYPLIGTKRKKYTTEPYISLASGNLCITISCVFIDAGDNKCVFCADFKTTEDSYNIELRGPIINTENEANSKITGILQKMNKEFRTDSLTGAYNRRYLNEKLVADINEAVKNNQSLSIILCDIDHFKHVNDTFGHLAGDLVLKALVEITKHNIRKNHDWIARYGGDEFLIVLVNADETAVRTVANKIKDECEQAVISHENAAISFTVSFGACTSHSKKMTVEEFIGLADKSLYIAKREGRNLTISTSVRAN
jgi:diguanylate cyclase (GGDEF)-like protein